MMKTEALLLLALIFGVLSAWSLILWLDFIIDEEKKQRGKFFNVIIKVGMFKEKSRSVIFMTIWIIVAIIGLIWSVITISNIYKDVGITSILIITVVVTAVVLYIIRKIKKF